MRRGSAALLLIPLLLSACGLSDDESETAIDTVRIAATTEVPAGTKLVIAEQNGTQSLPWNLANAGQGTPYEVDFADFSGGAAVIEALRSGAADVGSIGEAPVPIAVDSGVTDLVTVGLQANPGTSGGYYLVARPDSGVKTIEDLRGKRVAYPPGSGRHMVTAGLLKRHGLDLRTDVQPVELAGAEVVPTFAAGAVDAAIVLGNQYYQLGEPPILGDGKGINTGIQTLIVRRDVLVDPAKAAAIGDYVGRAVAANNWKDTHADQWIDQYYVKVQGITFEQGKKLYDEDGIASYYPIDERSTALFQTVADGLHETGTIKARVDVKPYVDGRYNHIVTAQNELDGVTPKSLDS
ncbi:ABC transporter substrate-binding protein [Mycolicibacterium conceptionense]|jgi:ABC-type nitrate/sulfonate/bicarbonate transport system substrate-binding protein|uniref:ABC transporter substrate-binding protein n=3 Tax=Mycobacteriaceae TaxID=1762 RepID=A0A0J8UGA4_9MYCO|nr:ABC transporter substrate-binding protein [Mycolicibacterium senegalense]KMV19425.1 ABC transporter substrate-binding protein [Mycolicibacterium conceptionense]KLO50320.1 ABC transporter substrate-binding protein [Mycolicibacterium senegalense]OBB04967.1 ABC transporter substrate-binding protein [Mycolicibacterium conceptionense]OBF00752.1 ABC transporter substrate-binding protein [Mycolicibacterium conceptionense]